MAWPQFWQKEDSDTPVVEQKSKLKDKNLLAAQAKEDRESELAKIQKENTGAVSQISRGQKGNSMPMREVYEQS